MKLPAEIKRSMKFSDAAFMGIMRWAFYEKLKETYVPQGIEVKLTYGYLTKNTRIANHLPKTHCMDARCISGHPLAEPPEEIFFQKKVRCHNRQIHKFTVSKGGVRKRNQAPYLVKDCRLFDKVFFKGQEYFIFGRRNSGFFDVRTLDGVKISPCAGYKKLRLLEPRKTTLTERRQVAPPTPKGSGFLQPN